MTPPHGRVTKKMFVPHIVSRWEMVVPSKGLEEGGGLFKLKCQGVLQNLVLDVWVLVFTQVAV